MCSEESIFIRHPCERFSGDGQNVSLDCIHLHLLWRWESPNGVPVVIFQRYLDSVEVPSPWLRANITPLFKNGERTDASNYRPVSLTCICSKLLEHIIHANVMDHFDKYSILTDKQHGFRRKHSCESQLIFTVHDLAKSLDSRSQIDMVIMDFSKAFDIASSCSNHNSTLSHTRHHQM